MLHRQHSAAVQVRRRPGNRQVQLPEAVPAAVQCLARLEAQRRFAAEPRFHVRWIAGDGVEAAAVQRTVPGALNEANPARRQPGGVAPGNGERSTGNVGGHDPRFGQDPRQRDSHRAGTGSQVQYPRTSALRTHVLANDLHQQFGLRPRHEHRVGNLEFQRMELPAPDDLRQGPPAHSFGQQLFETLHLSGRQFFRRVPVKRGPVQAERMGQQQLAIQPRSLTDARKPPCSLPQQRLRISRGRHRPIFPDTRHGASIVFSALPAIMRLQGSGP